MLLPYLDRHHFSYKLFPRICALLLFIIGGLIIAGYLFNIDLLKSPVSGITTAKFNSGICIILCGLILFAANADKRNKVTSIFYKTCTIAVLMISGATLMEFLTGREFGIDNLFMSIPGDGTACPHGMTFLSSINFFICGLCFLASEKELKGKLVFLLWPMGFVFFFSLFIFFTYLFKATIPATCYNYSSMPCYTAVAFLFISLGFAGTHPECRAVETLYSKGSGGSIARKILIPIFIFLPLLSFLRISAEQSYVFNGGYGVALMTVITLVLFTVIIFSVGRQLDLKELQLTRSENLFGSIVQNVREYSIFMLDKDGYIISWNEGAKRMKGYSAEEIIGKHFSIFYTEEEKARHEPETNLKLAEERGWYETEGWRIRKDGSQFFADIVLTAVYSNEGKLDGFIKVTRDVTQRRKAEEEKSRLLLTEAKHKELQNFVYILTHDVVAPMRNISTLSQWFSDEYLDKVDEQGKEWLTLMNEKIKVLGTMIDEVLIYLRAGKTTSEKKEIDCNKLVSDIIKMHTLAARKIMMDNTLPVVFASSTELKQVFTNLIDNAIKHNDKPVVLINIGCKDKGEYWEFYVKDNGPCIPKEYHAKVFEVFQTLKSKDETQSTGIGLATVKRSVESLGGKIWIENIERGGCAFLFTIKKVEVPKIASGT